MNSAQVRISKVTMKKNGAELHLLPQEEGAIRRSMQICRNVVTQVIAQKDKEYGLAVIAWNKDGVIAHNYINPTKLPDSLVPELVKTAIQGSHFKWIIVHE